MKGRSHTAEKRISMHPHKPHATRQPSRFSHTHRLSTDSPHNTASDVRSRTTLPHCWRVEDFFPAAYCFKSRSLTYAFSFSSASWRHYSPIDVRPTSRRFNNAATTLAVVTTCMKSFVHDVIVYQTSVDSRQRSQAFHSQVSGSCSRALV